MSDTGALKLDLGMDFGTKQATFLPGFSLEVGYRAYIELVEGPRILANVVADDPGAVHIGALVAAVFVPVTDPPDGSPSRRLLRFAPRGPDHG